jgi:hypothetical protein
MEGETKTREKTKYHYAIYLISDTIRKCGKVILQITNEKKEDWRQILPWQFLGT